MKYFQHQSNFRHHPSIRTVTESSGIVGYGCALVALEVLAEARENHGDPFELSLDDKRYGWAFWQREFMLKNRAATAAMLISLASAGVLDQEALEQRRVIAAPILQHYLDESARRKRA